MIIKIGIIIIALYCLIIPVFMFKDDIINFLGYTKKLKPEAGKKEPEPLNPEDIIGKSLPVRRHKLPDNATSCQREPEVVESGKKENIFVPEEEKRIPARIPNEDLDKVFSDSPEDNNELDIDVDTGYDKTAEEPDLSEEEEELAQYRSDGTDDFARGVDYDELGMAGKVIKGETIAEEQEWEACRIIRKVETTDLWAKMVSREPEGRERVSQVMDKWFSSSAGKGTKGNDLYLGADSIGDLKDFDIWKYI